MNPPTKALVLAVILPLALLLASTTAAWGQSGHVFDLLDKSFTPSDLVRAMEADDRDAAQLRYQQRSLELQAEQNRILRERQHELDDWNGRELLAPWWQGR